MPIQHHHDAAGVVLVVIDHDRGSVTTASLELLTAARALGRVHALWIGGGLNHGEGVLAEHGATTVHQVALDPAVPLFAPALAHVVLDVAAGVGATTLLLAASTQNAEVAALLALGLDAGLVIDACSVRRGPDGTIMAAQHAFAGTWTLQGEVLREHAVVTVKPHTIAAEALETAVDLEVRQHASTLWPVPGELRLLERTQRPEVEGPPLAHARVVVAGGRGTNGDFAPLRELAVALGGAVGATRVATDEGWIGVEAQIGQTGVTVAPALYIGAGVSGAVHHRGGMQSAGTIVAVNSDPDAPIFEVADFGVIGDLFTVLPQLTGEVLRRRA